MKRIGAFMLIICLLLGAVGCGNTEEKWQEQYDLGVRYLSEGSYEEAILAFTAAIEIDPKRPEAYGKLAETYLAMGDYEKAAAVWDHFPMPEDDEAFLSAVLRREEIYQEIQKSLESGEPGIWITDLAFDGEQFSARKETDFRVSVFYSCPEGENCQIQLSTNASEPFQTDFVKALENEVSGAGAAELECSLVPPDWGDIYFKLGVYMWSEQAGEFTDEIYLMADGSPAERYAATDSRGQIRFELRNNYIPYEELPSEARAAVDRLSTALIAGDRDALLQLCKQLPEVEAFKKGNSWFMDVYTTWQDYKVQLFLGDWHENYGDRYRYLGLELRPENGTGYFGSASTSKAISTAGRDSWMEYNDAAEIAVCHCEEWQWNGMMEKNEVNPHKWCSADGAGSEVVLQTTQSSGLIIDSLREGTFLYDYTRIYVDASSDNVHGEYTKKFDGGIELDESGVPMTTEPVVVGPLPDNSIYYYGKTSVEHLYW